MNKKFTKVFAGALAITMLAGCGGGTTDEAPEGGAEGGSDPAASGDAMVFNTVIGGNPTTLDPIMYRDANANTPIAMTHETLVRYDESGMGWEPGIAEDVVANEDFTVWTFTIREGATWADGTAITPEDIVYSYQRPLNPELASPNVNDFLIFENAREIYESRTEGEDAEPIEDIAYEELGVKVVDGNKVEFTLVNPTDYFLDYIRTPAFAPVQKATAEELGVLYGTSHENIMESGPFLMGDWQQEVLIVLDKNPSYWDAETVQVDQVNCNIIADANSVMSMYDTGALDFMKISQEITDSGKYQNVQELRQLSTQIIQFNSHEVIEGVETNYFANEKIREALALTFDREGYATNVVKQPKGAAYGIVPYGMRGSEGGDFREQQGELVFDLANFPGGELDGVEYPAGEEGAIMRANDLFDQGLEELGKTKADFEAEAEFVLPNNPETVKNTQAMQAMWKQHLDVEVLMKPLEMTNLMPYILNGTYQCLIGGGPSGSTYDAGEFLGFIYNENQWENEEYRTHWEKILVSSGEERIELIKEAERMACDAYLYIPVTFRYENYVQRENVEGLRQFSVGLAYDYKYVTVT